MSMFMNYTDIRTKLEQQLKCLENKMEGQCAMVLEVQEFFRKRAEVEQEYSAKLDKLAKAFQAKQKTEQQRKWVIGIWTYMIMIYHVFVQ